MFRPIVAETSRTLNLYTDASSQGAGAVLGHKWIQFGFPQSWSKFTITFLELFPIMVAVYVLGPSFKGRSVIFHTDNHAIMHVLNKQSSKAKLVMVLVRNLVLMCLALNIILSAQHVAGTTNILPDKLSRFQVTPGLPRQYGMKMLPEPVPSHLLPDNFRLDC